MNIIDIVL